MYFDGRKFSTLEALYAGCTDQARVSASVFTARVGNRVEKGEAITEQIIWECLTLDDKEYRASRMRRKTRIDTAEGTITDLQAWFDSRPGIAISYRTFWQRVSSIRKKGRLIDKERLEQALTMSEEGWREIEGGGRRNPTEFRGEVFPTLKNCLDAIGRSEDYQLVKRRVSKGWDIESALEPPRETGGGIIYRIRQRSTGRCYFGLTSLPLAERWRTHLLASENPVYPLHAEINRSGAEDFQITEVDRADTDEALANLEKKWIREHNTVWPHGLNGNSGGAVGGGRPKPCAWQGRTFASVDERNRILGAEYNLERHVVDRRIRDEKSLGSPQRRVTEKRLQDPDQQRQWLKLVRQANRGEVEIHESWRDPEVWRENIDPDGNVGRHLIRVNPDEPWGPDNFAWVTVQEKIEKQSGKSIAIGNRTFPTIVAAAKAHGVKTSTLKYRLAKGMSPEEAVATTSGPTSAKVVEFEGEVFPSMHKAAVALAERHGISQEKARDRIRRRVPTSRWASM